MAPTHALEKARAAKAKALALVGGHPEVNGVGIAPMGPGYCVKVNVATPSADLHLPSEIDGVPVRVEVVGEIAARTAPQPRA